MSDIKVNGFGIHLKVRDIAASRVFYEEALGFRPIFAYGDPEFLSTVPEGVATAPERYRGVTYEPIPNCPFEIADGHIAVTDRATFTSPIAGPKISAMIRVDSLVPLLAIERLRPHSPVRHYYWNTLELVVRDPDGWVIVFIAPYSSEEMKAVQETTEVEVVTPPKN